jgi:inorganic pyrophosphatase
MNLPELFVGETNNVNVVIETPQGSQIKFKYEEGNFKLHKYMPLGTCFPYDFGFLPHTRGGDGDPLDALVLNDFPSTVGCIIECRLIGVLLAKQKEKGKKVFSNDRFIAVPLKSHRYADFNSIQSLGDTFLKDLINFFTHYNAMQDREFKLLSVKGSAEAIKMIKES